MDEGQVREDLFIASRGRFVVRHQRSPVGSTVLGVEDDDDLRHGAQAAGSGSYQGEEPNTRVMSRLRREVMRAGKPNAARCSRLWPFMYSLGGVLVAHIGSHG